MGGKPLWRDYLPEASAAIMALREPDKAMMTAAKLEAVQTGRDDFGKIYRAMIDAAMIEKRRRTQATRGSLVAGVGRGRSGRFSCATPQRLPLPSTIRGRRESTRRSLFPGEGRSDGAREQAPVGHAVDPGFRRGAGVGANPLLTPHQTFHRSRGSGSLLT